MKQLINLILLICILWSSESCTKFVSIDPPTTQLVSQTVFENDNTANAAIVGIYSDMVGSGGFASGSPSSVCFLAGFSADELINYSAQAFQIQFFENTLNRNNSSVKNYLWANPYKYIYAANAVLEGLTTTKSVSPSVSLQLAGESKFIRAFCYFYLVNLFGDVPLITKTNYKLNDTASRTAVAAIYPQIIQDLQNAQLALPSDYSASSGERVRPNKWAATALLSRVYLYIGDWKDAETEATLVLNNTSLYQLDSDLNQVFLANSTESIWQLEPVAPGINTQEGQNFILTQAPTSQSMSTELINSFEAGDQRKTDWVDSIDLSGQVYYFPFKYKIQYAATVSEYSMVLRLAELYLIRAEARANLNNISGAANDINVIRNRAGLANTIASDRDSLLNVISQEKRIELFSEWGHRWLDLKRTGQADAVLSSIKAAWQSAAILYPIPQSEIQNDPNLSQNPGY